MLQLPGHYGDNKQSNHWTFYLHSYVQFPLRITQAQERGEEIHPNSILWDPREGARGVVGRSPWERGGKGSAGGSSGQPHAHHTAPDQTTVHELEGRANTDTGLRHLPEEEERQSQRGRSKSPEKSSPWATGKSQWRHVMWKEPFTTPISLWC